MWVNCMAQTQNKLETYFSFSKLEFSWQFVTDGSNQAIVTDPQSVGSVRRRTQVIAPEIAHYSSAENSPRDNGKVSKEGIVGFNFVALYWLN